MTGGQAAPTTPLTAYATTMPFGNFEHPFSLPYLADTCGAVYVARWTVLHVRRLAKSIGEAMNKKGFSFIEMISPCPTLYARRNRLGSGLDLLKFYHDTSVIQHGAPTSEVNIDYQSPIVVGKFIDRERPSHLEAYNAHMKAVLGKEFEPYGVPSEEDAASVGSEMELPMVTG